MNPTGPDRPGTGPPFRAVVLVGFMASGKTSVGRRLAARLGWDFRDTDAEIVARAGAPVETLFRERGETAFRSLEGGITAELLQAPGRVVASGGGWPAAAPDRIDGLPPDVLSVWLRVTAPVAVERAARQPGVRPLLAVENPEARAQELLEVRRPHYARARLHLDASDTSVDALVQAIVEYLDAHGRA